MPDSETSLTPEALAYSTFSYQIAGESCRNDVMDGSRTLVSSPSGTATGIGLPLGRQLMLVMNPSSGNPRIAKANTYETVAWKMVSRRI